MSITDEQIKKQVQNFSVETVRNILKLDNKGIARLCAKASMMPKKDLNGKTFFTKNDIEKLLRLRKEISQQVTIKRSVETDRETKSYATVPMKKVLKQAMEKAKSQEEKLLLPTKEVQKIQMPSVNAVEKICTSLATLENNLVNKISELVEEKVGSKLDEKLDGMDEVVVELVRCKTENETLRYKMNELNKELYNLKNELSKYKSIGFGVYIKKNNDSSLL